jgi:ABC-type nickel/cobalt efflux system permease component RcnA
MNRCIFFILIFLFSAISFPAQAQNPFTGQSEEQKAKPAFFAGNPVVDKILLWQRELKTSMTRLVRSTRESGDIGALLFLVLAAFSYGVIHAAGPGHGKVIALSYVLSQRPSYIKGILFSISVALVHGLSGIGFVLVIREILKTTITGNLQTFTDITKIASYSLIMCIGLLILFQAIRKTLFSNGVNHSDKNDIKTFRFSNPFLLALVVGIVPCTGVVMVMLFLMSLNLISLGIVLGVMISIGMAITISTIVTLAIATKDLSIKAVSNDGSKAVLVENGFNMVSGLMLGVIGALLLAASL